MGRPGLTRARYNDACVRVVSLLASATEIVCALDAGGMLVGRSHECDNPPWVRSLPQCSSPAFDVSLSSGEIDREVRRRMRSGEPMYTVDMDRIRALQPDIIIAQSHCEVCAVTPGDVERAAGPLPCPVLPIGAGTLDAIFAAILDIAAALGLEQRGVELVGSQSARLESLRARTASLPPPTVAAIEWTDPVYPMANWTPELFAAANARLVPPEADPDFLIVAPCGFDLERTVRERPVLENYEWWPQLRAVRSGRVAFADGNLYFNRSGITVTRTAEIIAEITHGVVTGEPEQGAAWHWLRS